MASLVETQEYVWQMDSGLELHQHVNVNIDFGLISIFSNTVDTVKPIYKDTSELKTPL